MSDLDIQQRDLSALREGYSPATRRFEIGSIVVYGLVMAVLAVRIAPGALHSPWLALSALMLGFVLADFVSGFVHWAADTWGTTEWPLVGKTLIRPFREHHVDQKEITRHGFVETNGNNCFVSIAPAVGAALLPQTGAGFFFASALMFSLCLAILGTNQFHKWAHMDSPPPLVGFLQRANLILPPEHHSLHHAAPYARHYCITVGWLNEALFRLRFFQTLEGIITAATGLLPREDDIGKRAALRVARQPAPSFDLPELAGPPAAKPEL